MFDLTIGIPTYNRAKFLKESLEKLEKMVENYNIEIVVSDNCSTDNTEEVVHTFENKIKNLSYFRNDKNLGFDKNFLNCLKKAKGEYIWLLSDDDVVLDGAIDSILLLLKRKPICMHLNTSSIANNIISHPRYNGSNSLFYNDKNLFLEKIGIFCTFISSLIFKNEYVKQIKDFSTFYNTNFLQTHVFIECMKNDGLYIINIFNCVAARNNDTIKYDLYKTWIYNYSLIYKRAYMECGFEKEKMDKILKKTILNEVYNFILIYRFTCNNSVDWDKNCISIALNEFPKEKKIINRIVNCSKRKFAFYKLLYKLKHKF